MSFIVTKQAYTQNTDSLKKEKSIVVLSEIIIINIYDSAQLMQNSKVNDVKDDDAHVHSSNTCRPWLYIPSQFLLAAIRVLIAGDHVSALYRHGLSIVDVILNSIGTTAADLKL